MYLGRPRFNLVSVFTKSALIRLNLKGNEMNITLNISLEVSKHYLPEGVAGMQLRYKHVRNYLEKAFGKPSCIGIARSATGNTVVVQYTDVQAVLSELYLLAHELGQDCIAYSIQDDDDGNVLGGALVGKYAHKWNYGIFNEDYFIPATLKLHYRIGLPL